MTSKVQIVTWGDPFAPDTPLQYGLRVGRSYVVSKNDAGTYEVVLYPTREEAATHAKDMRKRLKAKKETVAWPVDT